MDNLDFVEVSWDELVVSPSNRYQNTRVGVSMRKTVIAGGDYKKAFGEAWIEVLREVAEKKKLAIVEMGK